MCYKSLKSFSTILEERILALDVTNQNCPLRNAKLGADGIPYLYRMGNWRPICGHQFWDNQEGAKAFCRELGFPGGEYKKMDANYVENAIRVGKCKPGESISACTGGANSYELGSSCHAGKNVKVTISCDGHTPGSEIISCIGNIGKLQIQVKVLS